MVVQHNLTAMNSNRMLGVTTKTQAKSTEKLSSGYKINRAADDAAGLAISEKMRKQIRGLSQASLNAQDGISAVQTAEGALTEVHDMLQRMNELAIKAGNGTMSEPDRKSVQDEMDQLVTEIDRVSETTKFNETYLLKGEGKLSSKGVKAAVNKTDGAATPTYTTTDLDVTKATGNSYAGAVSSTLAPTTEDVATVTYLDAQGNQRTEKVKFQVGADSKATAANMADAINSNDALKKIFTATSDKSGNLSVVSKLDGNKTDNTKNKVSGIAFASYNSTATVKQTKMAGTATAAAGETVRIDNSNLTNGSSITIDGKTFTYDSTSGVDGISFTTLQDLKDCLGSNYDVKLVAKAEVEWISLKYLGVDNTTVLTKANALLASSKETKESGTIVTGKEDTALGSITASSTYFTDIPAADTAPTGKDSTSKTAGELAARYKDSVTAVGVEIVITRKADIDAKDALNFSLQVGADTTEENKISIDIESMSARSLGIDGITVTGKDSSNADAAVNTIAAAISKVSTQRSALGAVQNRLEHTINNLDNVVENTTSAEAQIRDTDMATEMVKYSNNNILAQAGQAMLAQANQVNQGVLSLLG